MWADSEVHPYTRLERASDGADRGRPSNLQQADTEVRALPDGWDGDSGMSDRIGPYYAGARWKYDSEAR
jgi:hypothetical protein